MEITSLSRWSEMWSLIMLISLMMGRNKFFMASISMRIRVKSGLCRSDWCRKTTITNLINRFYDIQSGMITYDGIDIKLIEKDSLRRSLGIVLQDTHLFTGTIAENIAYGRADATRRRSLRQLGLPMWIPLLSIWIRAMKRS